MKPPEQIRNGVATLKSRLRAHIPETFGWWVEIDNDIRVSIRWIWLGHPGVMHAGSVSDPDIDIALALVETVDWTAEVDAAIASVEHTEFELLAKAQKRRRFNITDTAHLVALPEPEPTRLIPVSLPEKRRQIGPLATPESPWIEQLIRAQIQTSKTTHTSPEPRKFRVKRGSMPGDFCLTKNKARFVAHYIQWEPYNSLCELLDAIKSNPPETFTGAWLFGVTRIDGSQSVARLAEGY